MSNKTDIQLKNDNVTLLSTIDNRYNHLNTLKTLIDDVIDSKSNVIGSDLFAQTYNLERTTNDAIAGFIEIGTLQVVIPNNTNLIEVYFHGSNTGPNNYAPTYHKYVVTPNYWLSIGEWNTVEPEILSAQGDSWYNAHRLQWFYNGSNAVSFRLFTFHNNRQITYKIKVVDYCPKGGNTFTESSNSGDGAGSYGSIKGSFFTKEFSSLRIALVNWVSSYYNNGTSIIFGDAKNINSFTTYISKGTNTENVNLVLPVSNGTSGQVLSTNGSGQLSFIPMSPGGLTGVTLTNKRIAFGSTGNTITESSNLTWDNSNNKLSIGTQTTAKYISQYSSGGANEAILISNDGAGATMGVQNRNATGFAGVEYIDNSGNTKVFTGFNNNNGQEFRFDNIASGGYIHFITNYLSRLRVENDGSIIVGISTTTFSNRFNQLGISNVNHTVRAIASQTADLTQWQNSSSVVLMNVTPIGNLGFNNTEYGGGVKVTSIGNASTVPTINPTVGIIHYAEGGVWKYRDAGGFTITI